jgi:hypothetical protein
VARKSTHQNRLPRIPGELRIFARELESYIKEVKSSNAGKPAVTRQCNPLLLARDFAIKKYAHLSDREICGKLDDDLQWVDAPTVGLPKDWIEKFGIRTFLEGYEHSEVRPLAQKMISKAKKRVLPS